MKYPEDYINRVHCADCLEFMKGIPDNSVDLVLTDPPYNIGKEFDNDNLDKEKYFRWCTKWIRDCVRVLKVGGALYITLGWQCVAEIKTIFNKEEFMRLKNWIIWYRFDGWKGNNGFAQSHEHILYFIKDNITSFDLEKFGKHITKKRLEAGYKTVDDLMEAMGLYSLVHRQIGKDGYYSGTGFVESGKKKPTLQEMIKLNKLLELDKEYNVDITVVDEEKYNVLFNKVDVSDDVWVTPTSEKDRLGHPTQKPVSLFRRIIQASSNKDNLILDPFLGSGTTAVACKELGRRFIGIEINPEYCKIAKKRLVQEILF